MPYQIRIRRDVAATWEDNDPILAVGEMGFATDTNEVRVGNGVDVWSNLEPIKSDADAIKIAGYDLEAGPPLDGEVIQFDTDTNTWVYATVSGGPGGGVTSVGLTMPSPFTVTAGTSPVTSSGTIAVTLDNQTANRVFAGPTNGAAATPTFRALVTADIPDLSNAYQINDSALTSISTRTNELGSGPDQMLYLSGAKTFSRTNLTTTARTLLADTSTTAMRSTLGLTINTDVQAYDAGLQSIAGLTTAPDKMLYTTALDTYAVTTLTQFGRSLIDDADAEIARTTLGFKTAVGVATAPQAETTVKYVRAAQASLTKGMVVYVSGSNGNNLNVSKAQADAESTSSKTIGLLLQDFTNVGDLGYAVTEGLIEGLNTNGLTPGAAVWLSPTTAGGWTTTKPTAPNHLVFLGWIVKDNASTGSIYVKVTNGQELDELHDVQISSSANNDILQYDNTVSPPVWKNRTLANAGIATSSHTHGNITNAGAINSTANLPLITTTGGVITTGSFGTTANTFCQGNDSRLDLQTITLTGNVTGSGTGSFATTIATGVITPSMFSTAGATSGDVIKYNGTAWALAQDATGSGSGTPGGNTTEVQYNNSGAFAGSSNFTWTNGSSLLTVNGNIQLSAQGDLRFADANSSNYVAFQAPATVSTDVTWTLPAADGSANQVLSTDGSGALSWVTAGGTKTYAVFTPLANQPPAANYATLDTVNTTSPIAVLDFNDGTDEYAIFVGIMPEGSTFTSGLKIILFWTGDTTSTNSVVWSAEIENDEGYDIDTDGWDTNTVSTTTAHNGVAGQINKTTITLGSGDVDGIAAGQPYRLRVFRDANNGSDNYVGDAMLMAVEVRNGA